MRINNSLLLTVTATVQLSSLPFASATMCKHSLEYYGCGQGYYQAGYFTQQPGENCRCCCERLDGDGFHRTTCDPGNYNVGNILNADKGCGSCMGIQSCQAASDSVIGDNSCVGKWSCFATTDSYIKQDSCRAEYACASMFNSHVGTNSCGVDDFNTKACNGLQDSTVGDHACEGTGSCRGIDSSVSVPEMYGRYLTIGSYACNLEYVCQYCENYSVVPDGACNGDKSDTYIGSDGYRLCNYCSVSAYPAPEL